MPEPDSRSQGRSESLGTAAMFLLCLFYSALRLTMCPLRNYRGHSIALY